MWRFSEGTVPIGWRFSNGMEEEIGLLAFLSVIGLIFGAVAITSFQRAPPSEADHPRPAVESVAPAETAEAHAPQSGPRRKQTVMHATSRHDRALRLSERALRLSEKAATARAEETSGDRAWPRDHFY